VAAAAIRADFSGAKLVPSLRGVQDHAAFVERLKGERRVGGNLREEARVGLTVRIARLATQRLDEMRRVSR